MSWSRRTYQVAALQAARVTRVMALFWARQCRKSTTLGDIAFDKMAEAPGKLVIGASASLLTGSELVSKAVTAADQAVTADRDAEVLKLSLDNASSEAAGRFRLTVANSDTGKEYKSITTEQYKHLYRSGRLEMRLFHDKTAYSRLQVIAPNPSTARGWSGTVLRDEAGFLHPQLERDLQVAVKPIIDTDPRFQLIYASNLPREDRHPFFEMTMPTPGTVYPPTARGNFYLGQNGILIHRVALADAYAAGHVLYDTHSGKPLSYEQFCKAPENRLGLDESYRLLHKLGGAAAIDLMALLSAQAAGIGKCHFAFIENHGEFLEALQVLRGLLGSGKVGIGVDQATSESDTANPYSITVTEKVGGLKAQRLVVLWKEKNPKILRERLRMIVKCVNSRPAGGPVRRVCIDASNEALHARETEIDFRGLVPVQCVVNSVKVEPVPSSYEKDPIYKTYLGDLYSAAVNDNLYLFPPGVYFKDDHRLVIKTGGLYQCDPQPDGAHGDTFDSGKLADFALSAARGCDPAHCHPAAMSAFDPESAASLTPLNTLS